MSIRYDRQYRMNADINGPIGPDTNEDQTNLSFLNNNDLYLGGGSTVGGETYVEPPVNTNPPFETPIEATPQNPTPDSSTLDLDPLINYEIAASSNLENEIGDKIKIKFEVRFTGGVIVDSGELFVSDKNTDNKSTKKSNLLNGTLNLYLEDTSSENYSITKIYYANKLIAAKNPTDYTKWNTGDTFIGMNAKELLTGGVAVAVIMEKVINYPKPTIVLDSTTYTKQIKDSDTDGITNIKFSQKDCDFVDFYIAADKKIRVNAVKGSVELSFKKDFDGIYGNKKIIIVPVGDLYGTGDKKEITINFISVNDFPSITEIDFVDTIDIPSFSDFNIDYNVKYTTFATTTVDIWLKQKDGSKIGLASNLAATGTITINLKTLREKYPNWVGSDNVTLILKPYNSGGDVVLEGNEYEIKTSLLYPLLQLDETIIKKSIFDAFREKLSFTEPEKDSKHLTHLANFGNDEQILISSWETDKWSLSKKSKDELGNEIVKPEDEVNSLILKLYSPLPANIQKNSTFWITKLMSNPLIETVILTQQNDINCPPIKGPNFNIGVDFVQGKSTGYESLDNILLNNDVTSSSNLITTYLSSSLSNTDELNIEYASGSTYLWNNFVHFSSAKERVDNFVYKVQLIETYETAVSASNASQAHSGSLASIQEAERQLLKKNQLINNFDGFETFLYTSSSVSWPHDINGDRLYHTTNDVVNWYSNLIDVAEEYDIDNPNWVLNNIPQYIRTNEENASLLLFFSMIGQHFDNIYFYTKSIEKTRKLGYKSKDGISDKLLFDVLKSFNWDAKNLSADSKLWDYAFGLDSNGNQKFETPAKQRTYEVWRRIVNNLPYLLKHKGTKKGIYALMSCYGIPASNLSILEFGGPEVTDENKGKLVIDNITTALIMNTGSYFDINWQTTDKGRKPNTIELFVKPAYSREWDLISGSNWGVTLSGSANSEYGVVNFNYGSSIISSSLLPIFNNRFFGVSVSSGSEGLKLDLRQSDKERTIFESSIIKADTTNWNSGNKIRVGKGYSGSVDEFRLWSEQLNTQVFYQHASFPEMVNGNSHTASTHDLYFRLDFEYPKNLALTSSLINVDTNIYFSGSLTRNDYENGSTASLYSENIQPLYSASASGFTSIGDYPYNFEAIDRTIVMDYPDGGASRFSTNKVRFESQYTLTGEEISGSVGVTLSSKSRSTKKAFDQSPTDSNRVGLFFSPTKELNMDIAKSFGGLNLDNYIGDPSDKYKSNYKRLDDLRHYYFQRFDGRDIYAYINLIKLYEKSMFEDIKKMLPARVKATTGLLIEPHFLERSKVAQKKPTGDDYQQETQIHYGDTTILTGDNEQYETIINADLSEDIFGENYQYEGEIFTASIDNIIAENYQYDTLVSSSSPLTSAESYQQNIEISVGLEDPTILTEIDIYDINTIVGQSDYEKIGFGIYGQNGHSIRTYLDENNRVVKQRIKVDLIKEQKQRDIVKYKVVVNGQGDPRGGMILTSSVYYETKLNIQPFSGSKVINAGTGSIVEVIPLSGYLPTHFRNTSDLTRGLENSFFRGSKNTAATTLDGSPPVETFNTNPNTLRVNKAGRDASEPILEVE